jgi:hypothetical protein
MKINKLIYLLFILTFACSSISTEAQVKITDVANLTMDANSILELESTNRGLLIPRMAINSLLLPAPLVQPVPAGMQVYSLGGTIPDGFYYWNSVKWVRMVASTDAVINQNMVTKSASATLLKTENMVFATGDITLTFPIITSADDGLEFTIKNIGIFTDLISVTGGTGTTIDNVETITLSRWKARTFIANNGNWFFKEKEVMKENILDVGAFSSFNTIASAVAFLNLHMAGPTVIQLGVGTFPIASTQIINLPYPVTFVGSSYGETIVTGALGVSGTPLFNCQTTCFFKMVEFTAYSNTIGNDGILFSGSANYNEIKDCNFNGFNRSIASSSNNSLWVFESDFNNCTGAGVEIAAGSASGGSLKLSEGDFTNCAKGIHLLSGADETVSVTNSTFYNTTAGTDIGVLYVPATFTSFSSLFITNNSWNIQGTYMSGFDFTRSDGRDANAFLINNAGMENENPHCRLNVNNNTSATRVTNNNTFYKAVWLNTSNYTCKWGIGLASPASGNRITYQPNNLVDAWAVITGNIEVDNSSRVITIAIVKNGQSTVSASRFGETDIRITTAAQPFQFSTVVYVPDMAKTDFLELYVTSSKSGDDIIFRDIQWFTNTQ